MLQFFIAFLAKATFLNFFKMPRFANYSTIFLFESYDLNYDKRKENFLLSIFFPFSEGR
jgi:hypothetical protein